MMDGAVTTTTSDAQLTKEFSSEGKRPFLILSERVEHGAKNVVTGTLGIDSFSLCLIESTHMHRPSSGVGLLMPFLHILNARHIAGILFISSGASAFRLERILGSKMVNFSTLSKCKCFFVKLSNSK